MRLLKQYLFLIFLALASAANNVPVGGVGPFTEQELEDHRNHIHTSPIESIPGGNPGRDSRGQNGGTYPENPTKNGDVAQRHSTVPHTDILMAPIKQKNNPKDPTNLYQGNGKPGRWRMAVNKVTGDMMEVMAHPKPKKGQQKSNALVPQWPTPAQLKNAGQSSGQQSTANQPAQVANQPAPAANQQARSSNQQGQAPSLKRKRPAGQPQLGGSQKKVNLGSGSQSAQPANQPANQPVQPAAGSASGTGACTSKRDGESCAITIGNKSPFQSKDTSSGKQSADKGPTAKILKKLGAHHQKLSSSGKLQFQGKTRKSRGAVRQKGTPAKGQSGKGKLASKPQKNNPGRSKARNSSAHKGNKKAASKQPGSKQTTPKKVIAEKPTSTKSTPKKAMINNTTGKKAGVKKATPKKATSRKHTPKKATAKKSEVKKVTPKKTPSKKSGVDKIKHVIVVTRDRARRSISFTELNYVDNKSVEER
ncbi:unnamed protein product [Clonostachys rosea]|uniref:Uncharacterized protein n=1 Tax=Bionectria ochroleuca TaxID=29856 RepID=A0ABY6UQJ7_BIOOC|nr:unnamed protein product [Clonostachys rosea]